MKKYRKWRISNTQFKLRIRKYWMYFPLIMILLKKHLHYFDKCKNICLNNYINIFLQILSYENKQNRADKNYQ